ncbi:hypothetical protein AAVH_41920, partial [Aphelenchoides avenae]
MALYGQTVSHKLPADLKSYLPDVADPNNDAILESILQYAMRKAATQLADNYPALLKDLPRLLINASPSAIAGDNRTTSLAHAATALAYSVLGPAARADPLDQDDTTYRVPLADVADFSATRDPAIPSTSTTRCAPGPVLSTAIKTSAARHQLAHTGVDDSSSSAASRASEALAPDQYTVVAHRSLAEAALEQHFSQGNDVHVLRTPHNDSPPKNETVCFCDESTFLHFGCLLRPEVLMIPTPVPSIEEALQCVCNNTTNEVRRVVLWFSESHATPLSPALQLRLAIELSRYCATHYPAVVQYVVATPSIGSRHDVWTFGLIKILAQMQVLLPHARLVVCQRGSRNITDIDVYYLKLYLRDHCHLNLWSRYDAGTTLAVKVSYAASTQQQQMIQATSSDVQPAAEAPVAARSRSQRRVVPINNDATPIN